MDSGDDRYSTVGVGRDWPLIPGRASALIDTDSRMGGIGEKRFRCEMKCDSLLLTQDVGEDDGVASGAELFGDLRTQVLAAVDGGMAARAPATASGDVSRTDDTRALIAWLGLRGDRPLSAHPYRSPGPS